MTNQVNKYPSFLKRVLAQAKNVDEHVQLEKYHVINGSVQHAFMNGLVIYYLKGGRGKDFFVFFFVLNFFFLSCSENVLKYIPQDVWNNTLVLSHIVCPKFNSHVYKLKRWAMGEYFCFYFCNWGPKRYSHQRESRPMFQKN